MCKINVEVYCEIPSQYFVPLLKNRNIESHFFQICMQLKICKDNFTSDNPACKIKSMQFLFCYKALCILRMLFLFFEYNDSFLAFTEETED